ELAHAHGPRLADARKVVPPEVDEHDVLRPGLLGGEKLLGVALAWVSRPGDRVEARPRPLQLHEGLGGGADEGDAVEVEEEVVGRGIDAAERPIEREGRYVRR